MDGSWHAEKAPEGPRLLCPPEAVLLLAPQRPFGGVETGLSEGSPQIRFIPCHGVVETAVSEQPEVSHPDPYGGRRIAGGPVDSAAAYQVGGQAVGLSACGAAGLAEDRGLAAVPELAEFFGFLPLFLGPIPMVLPAFL